MKDYHRSILTFLAFSGLVLTGCAGDREAAWNAVTVEALNASQSAQHATAIAARDAMFANLMTTLSSELAAQGPSGAIAVCKDKAPEVAKATGERFGVEIGRTSWKLRNPENAAPSWAEALLAKRPQEPRLSASPEGHLGVTLPIRLQSQCLSCHGPADSIPGDVREALATLYPEDRATGFREGELRGWFWVEVPPPAR